METNDLTTYPLATLFAWRSAVPQGKQGVSDEAMERREIQGRVMSGEPLHRLRAAARREAEEFEDLL